MYPYPLKETNFFFLSHRKIRRNPFGNEAWSLHPILKPLSLG